MPSDIPSAENGNEALLRSELRFRAIIDGFADPLLSIDRDLLIRYVNGAATRVLGHGARELLARPVGDLFHPDERASLEADLTHALASPGATKLLEHRVRRADGAWELAETTPNGLVDPLGRPMLVLHVRCVTERRGLQAQLLQQAKMESVGRLAAGVAHDFNNLLTVILSCSSSLRYALSHLPPALAEDVREIEGAAQRAAELTGQLLAFARKQIVNPAPLDLGQVAYGNERMLRRLLGEDIELRVEREPGLWAISADAGQVTQVIVNLAVNARDAMPKGGTLEIRAVNVTVTADMAIRDTGLVPGEWVRLVVRDSGVGMSSETRAHIFEPFFTTKEQSKGTGLGLATVYGIVKQAGGHIHVHSELGRGTTFDICFPRILATAGAEGRPAEQPQLTGTECVLVVEDDPGVRAVTVRTLQSAGYEVRAVSRPQEALDLPREEAGRLHLLITDVVMPGLDGRLLAGELRNRLPSLRVLFVSGYAPDTIAERNAGKLDGQFLAKPFTGKALLAKVRAVLDAR